MPDGKTSTTSIFSDTRSGAYGGYSQKNSLYPCRNVEVVSLWLRIEMRCVRREIRRVERVLDHVYLLDFIKLLRANH